MIYIVVESYCKVYKATSIEEANTKVIELLPEDIEYTLVDTKNNNFCMADKRAFTAAGEIENAN